MMTAAGIGLVQHGERIRAGQTSAAPYRVPYLPATRCLLRKAAERTVNGLWTTIGKLLDLFPPAEYANYIANSG